MAMSPAAGGGLDGLKRSAAFHNTVDVWVGACGERGERWDSAARYAEFVGHLREGGVRLRPFQLCVSDGESPDAHERAKAEFARAMKEGEGEAEGGAGAAGVYSVRLDGRAAEAARSFFR